MVVKLVGVINEHQVAFSRRSDDADIWDAIAPKNLSGQYVVELTGYDGAGNQAYVTSYIVTIDMGNLKVSIKPFLYKAKILNGFIANCRLSKYYARLQGMGVC